MQGFQIHEKFERGEYIESCYVHQLVNYICGNLNCWTPNHIYWEEQYNYCNKLSIVIKYKIARGLPACAKKGEMICYKTDQLINFVEDQSHRKCCGTVYMVEIRCCYCFFYECCISLYRKETFGQLVERIYKLLNLRYENEKKRSV